MPPDPPRPKNLCRRSFGLLLGFGPALLLLASLISGLFPSTSSASPWSGIYFIAAGTFIACFNFHLSFLRPYFHHRRHGSMDDYRHVSGAPILGTILLILGGLSGFGAVGSAAIGLCAMALDTGGSAWFLIATWGDQGLWDD